MSRDAGVLRGQESLAAAAAALTELGAQRAPSNVASWEATNLVTVATALVAAASSRRETRGCHWREDFIEARPEWLGHLTAGIGPDGAITEEYAAR
jgi:L-aspartate oxidase